MVKIDVETFARFPKTSVHTSITIYGLCLAARDAEREPLPEWTGGHVGGADEMVRAAGATQIVQLWLERGAVGGTAPLPLPSQGDLLEVLVGGGAPPARGQGGRSDT